MWLPRWYRVKNLLVDPGDERLRFDPWVGKILWSRKWQPTSILFPGKFYGQRSLEGSPWHLKEVDTTEDSRVHCAAGHCLRTQSL